MSVQRLKLIKYVSIYPTKQIEEMLKKKTKPQNAEKNKEVANIRQEKTAEACPHLQALLDLLLCWTNQR